ncbi:MAG: flagellar type III secretion system pore protein FliP [Candidatus Latescibacteria bacterium]|nr:flagellar type III secretion system pore protein FliP [Candidatus Latescibacterota bacterium]
MKNSIITVTLLVVMLSLLGGAGEVSAQALPKISLGVENGQNPRDFVVTLQIIFLLAILSLAPSLLIMLTSFTRIVVVFSFLRQAIGTQQLPPNQVIIGLALFLTFFIMTPVWDQVNDRALQPYIKQQIDQATAIRTGMEPIRAFMLKQTREKDLMLFMNLAKLPQPRTVDDLPNRVLIPSFVISELRTAFQISIVLFIPFIIIDMVVASTLLSMGMMMLPPAMISLPFKLLLFVMVDGWHLIARSLVLSFM